MARVFSQKHTSTFVGNVGIYSVGTESVHQIGQSGKTECFASVSQEGLTRLLPVKTLQSSICLSLHILSLSHTTLKIKSHIKYRVQKIEHNYLQIWHGIKANKTYSCKLQFYKVNHICPNRKKPFESP